MDDEKMKKLEEIKTKLSYIILASSEIHDEIKKMEDKNG